MEDSKDKDLHPNNGIGTFLLIMTASCIDAVLVGCGFMWIHDTYLPEWWYIGVLVAAAWLTAVLCVVAMIAGIIVHIIQCITLRRINRQRRKSTDDTSITSITSTQSKQQFK